MSDVECAMLDVESAMSLLAPSRHRPLAISPFAPLSNSPYPPP